MKKGSETSREIPGLPGLGHIKEPSVVAIPYGDEVMKLVVRDHHDVVRPREPEVPDPSVLINRSLSHPFGSESLDEFVKGSTSVLVIVNDATRPSSTPLVLRHLHPFPGNRSSVRFLVATGTHPSPGIPKLGSIFGELASHYSEDVHFHDARDQDSLVYQGRTHRGTEVEINRMVTDADAVICIGNVKPHYFAGFAGGRKSLIPGVAGYRTIEMNHSHALDDGSRPMALGGNPVAEDMDEGVRMLGDTRIFSIQTVMDGSHELVGCFSGDIFQSFRGAVELCEQIYRIPVERKANIVVTVNPHPMDINLYQSQHAIENVMGVVEEGGIVIMVSKCWGGIGNPSFLDLLDRVESFEDVRRLVEEGYRLGYHKAYRIMRMREVVDLWAVTDLPDEVIAKE